MTAGGGSLGSIWTEFRIHLDQLQEDIRRAEDDLRDGSSAMDRISQETSEAIAANNASMTESFQNVGMGLTAAGAVLAVGLGAAMSVTMQFEESQNKLQTSLGITAEEAEHLASVAKDVWKEGFGEDLNQVVESVGKVRAVLGELTDQELREFTEGALTIQETWGYEMDQVNKTVAVMTKNFDNLSNTQALDIITVGLQEGGDYAQDLLDTLWEYSPQFATMGFSAEQFMQVLIAGAEAGAFNMDKLGDAVKEFHLRSVDGSKATAEGFFILGLDAEYMATQMSKGGESANQAFMATLAALTSIEDPLARNTAGVALFGTQWEDVRENAILAMQDGMNSTIEFDGAIQAAGENLKQGFGPQMEKLSRSIGDFGIAIGDTLAPALGVIAGFLTKIMESFNALPEPIKQGIAIFLALSAAVLLIVGPILMLIGFIPSIAAGFATLAGVVGPLGGAFGAMWLAITGPVGLVVAAIAAVIAIGYLLYKNWDDIKERLSEIWESIKEKASVIWDSIIEYYTKTVPNALMALVDWFKELPGRITVFLLELLVRAPYLIGLMIGKMLLLVIEGGQAIIIFFQELPGKILAFIIDLKNRAEQTWQEMSVRIVTKTQELIANVVRFFSELPEKVSTFLRELPTRIQNTGVAMVSAASTAATNVRTGLIDGIKNLPSLVWDIFMSVKNKIAAAARALADAARSAANSLWQGFKDGLGIRSPSYIEKAMTKIMDSSGDTVNKLFVDFRKISAMSVVPDTGGYSLARNNSGAGENGAGGVTKIELNFNGPLAELSGVQVRSDKDILDISRNLFDQISTKVRAHGKGVVLGDY